MIVIIIHTLYGWLMPLSAVEDPAREYALGVHASINSVFEDSIFPPGYEASFRNPLSHAEMRRVKTQSTIDFNEVTPYSLSEGVVNVRVGYDAAREQLAVKDVLLPVTKVRGSNVVGLLLRRTNDGRYLFAHEDYDGTARMPYASKAVRNRVVRHILGLCGFSTDALPVNHQDLRLRLAEMADAADTHTVMEKIAVPIPDPLLSLEVTRASNLTVEKGENLARRGDVRIKTPKKSRRHFTAPPKMPSIKTFETILGARAAQYDAATGRLKQVHSIAFTGVGGEIDTPVITVEYDQRPTSGDQLATSTYPRKLPSSDVLLKAIDEALFEHLSAAEQERRQSF